MVSPTLAAAAADSRPTADPADAARVDAARVDVLCRRPVLIVGSPRGGTTWVQRILLSDPRVCGGQETHFFNSFWPVLDVVRAGLQSTRGVGMLGHWSPPELLEAIYQIWRRTVGPFVVAGPPTAEVLVEKTPDHATVLRAALTLLPEARVVHVIRDSRAVAASLLAAAAGWGKSWAPDTATKAAVVWQRYTKAAMDVGRQLPADRYTEVYYEDLVADPQFQVARLFAFAGLPLSPDAAAAIAESQQFDRQKESGGSALPSVQQAAAPEPAGFFRKGKPDAWRTDLTLSQKLTVWRYTRKLMGDLGYTWAGRPAAAK